MSQLLQAMMEFQVADGQVHLVGPNGEVQTLETHEYVELAKSPALIAGWATCLTRGKAEALAERRRARN